MRKKERDRLKVVVYDAYMAGHARGGKTEEILEKLERKYRVSKRTIQGWISDVRKEREAMVNRMAKLEDDMKIVASGDFYYDKETEEAKPRMLISDMSEDGRLLA